MELGKRHRRGQGEGEVRPRVQRTIKGTKVIKNGTADNPAYLIEQEDGAKVLKSGSELHAG